MLCFWGYDQKGPACECYTCMWNNTDTYALRKNFPDKLHFGKDSISGGKKTHKLDHTVGLTL